jgi:hypothetical protein
MRTKLSNISSRRVKTPASPKKRPSRVKTPASPKKRPRRVKTPASPKKRPRRVKTPASPKKRPRRVKTPASPAGPKKQVELGNILARCMKCRKQQKMGSASMVVLKNGRNAVKGVCPLCSTKMFKFV